MSVSVAQQSHAPLGTLISASFSGGGSSRQVGGGAEPAAYLAAISPSENLSSSLYNRDHSSPVDSPAYPYGGSEQRATAANFEGVSPEPPSSRLNAISFTNDVCNNTNNGSTSKTEFSNISLSDMKTSASIPKRDTGASSLQNTSTVSGAAGLSDDSDQDKFDLESFMRNFPKSTMSFPERVPIPEFTHRFDDLATLNSTTNPYQKPAAPDPEPRAAATTAANDTPSDKMQETDKDNDDGSGDKADDESEEDKALFNSHLASRLKSSIRSEFLSKELFASSKCETTTRTLDDIMRDYGIENCVGTQAYKSSQFSSSVSGSANVSGNNESVKPLEPFNTSRLSAPQNIALMETPNAMQNPLIASKDFTTKSVPSEKSSLGITQLKSVNFSQNNETDTGMQQQDDTKSFGTCVDMTLSALASKYQSTSRTASSYNNTSLDKSAPYPGDISFQASNDYKTYDGQPPKATTSYGKYSSAEFGMPKDGVTAGLGNELSGSYSPTRSNNFRLYSQLGAADALGFSLQAEKQRLRNIDAMIATTPLSTRYNEMKPYKFTTSNSFVANDFESKRRYSTPALGATTTYPYRNEINSRVGWSTGAPQSTMGKSVSAPTYEYNRGVSSTGSSVDAQYYASRDGGSGRNYQYNNCTYMDKALAEKMLNARDATTSLKKKTDHGFKPSPKASSPNVGRGSPTRIALARPISANNVKVSKPGTAGRKQIGTASAPRACVAGRKKVNTNESRMMHADAFSEFDFVKDLSKMWQQSMQNMEPKIAPKLQKYQPYKPVSVDEKKMQDRSGTAADHGCANNKSRNSWSTNYEQDHGSLLDMEASMAKWSGSAAHGQNKVAPSKQKCVSGTKSYTTASYVSQQPKSILKNMCSKSALTRSSTTITQSRTGPKSLTTSSKAYPVTTAQMFAGLAFKKKAQNSISASSKPKSVKNRSKTLV